MATILIIQKTKLHQHDNDSFNPTQSVLIYFRVIAALNCTELQQGLMRENLFLLLELKFGESPHTLPPKANDDF